MPNRFESVDTDVKEISEVSIDAGMINYTKFSCDQYVFLDDQGDLNADV